MKRLLLFVFSLFLLTPLSVESKVVDIDFSDNGISFTYDFSDFAITNVNDTISFSCPGFLSIIGEGLPGLPRRLERIEIPAGMILGNPIISEVVDTIPGWYNDALSLHPENMGEILQEHVEISSDIWPEQTVNVLETGIYRDRNIGKYIIMPVRYDFTNNAFLVSRQLHFEIPFLSGSYSAASRTYTPDSCVDHNICVPYYGKRLTFPLFGNFSQPEILSLPYQPPFDSEAILIISPQALSVEAHRLAKWKQRMGYSVIVYVPDKDTYLKTPGNIKSIIKTEYQSNKNLEYVILFGGGNYITPQISKNSSTFQVVNNGVTTPQIIYPYTDFYFGCMDGDADEQSDLCIGRIPAHHIEDAKTFVDKVINYEKNPPFNDGTVINTGDFFNTGLHISEWNSSDSTDDRNFIWTSEKIGLGMREEGYSTKRVYYAKDDVYPRWYPDNTELPSVMRKPLFKWAGTANNITQFINNGVGYVFSRGHGDELNWTHMFFNTSHATQLKNGNKLPYVFSVNCLSGRFYGYSQGAYSLCETLLFNKNGGAIATICAQDWSIHEYNDIFSAGLFEALVPCKFYDFYIPSSDPDGLFGSFGGAPTYEIGRIMEIGKDIMEYQIDMHPNLKGIINSKGFKYNRDIYHCLGDPTMKVYIHRPKQEDIREIMNGNSSGDPRRIIIAYESQSNGNKTYYNSAYQTNLNLWGPQLCVPGNNNISVVGDGYVPVLMEDVEVESENILEPRIESIEKRGSHYLVEISDYVISDTLIMYDIYGNMVGNTVITSNIVSIPIPNTIGILTIVHNGGIIDSRVVK